VPTFKSAYLIHGDDHGRIGERRARLRALAERESGAQGVEVLEGDAATPDAAAAALNTMTFAIGRRFIIVDGLEAALASIEPETTIAFFAREEGRTKLPPRLTAAVNKAGGDIAAEETVKPWELPKWVLERAREMGLALEPEAARALVQHVGERQQRLLRELEKLALEVGPSGRVDVEEIESLTAPSAERKAWALADALVAGEAPAATRVYLALRGQGERVPGLLYWISQRLRAAHDIAQALESGEPAAQIKRRLRMPPRAADRLIADARRSGAGTLRIAIEETADLELTSRGGGSGGESEDTAMIRAIQRIGA
jgi:DNA polymerase III subunit delta